MEQHGWELISFDNGASKLLVKMERLDAGGPSTEITVGDLVNVWRETLAHDHVKKRCKKLNPRLEASSESILQHIKESVSNHSPDVFSTHSDSSEILKLTLKNSFHGGIPFIWEFSCKILRGQDAIDSLVGPLLTMITTLQCANEQLIRVIDKKDMEIRDYKGTGIKVSRPYLETVEFKREEFNQDLRGSLEYRTCIAKDSFTIATDDSVNARLIEIEKDLECPITVASSSHTHLLCTSPNKKPHGKVVGRTSNRRMQNNRKRPKGVEVLTDSENESNDETTAPTAAVRRAVPVGQNKGAKKKKVIDKRKKLF